MNHLTSINAVLQHQIKRTAREWLATPQATRRALVQDLLETLQASSSSFNNCTEPFEEDGRTYLLYAVAGESGIAIAEICPDEGRRA